MPGSTITCQGLSSVYDSFYGVVSSNEVNFLGLTLDASADTFNVNTSVAGALPFPFQTGDVVYHAVGIQNETLVTRYFAIRVSATSIKVATTYANAIDGVAANLTDSTGSIGYMPHQISNAFMVMKGAGQWNMTYTNYFNKNLWQSSAFSVSVFSFSENIAFDFTIENWVMCGIQTITGSYGIGMGVAGQWGRISGRETGGTEQTNRFSTSLSLGANLRIRLQNRIISVQRKETNNSYTTIYTTTTINNTELFRFFAYFSLNNTKLSNCTITYL